MDFVVKRSDLKACAVDNEVAVQVGPGEILVDIDRFSLTSNNISYGAAGDSLQYFNFFPHVSSKYVKIPVWGVGRVAVSRCDDVQVGERLYGFFPMSRTVVLQPAKVEAHQFFDGAAHRKELAVIYNTYSRLDSGLDPFYSPKTIDLMLLFRPLFSTSWLLNDFFQCNSNFGAKFTMISSASSKTSYGLAFCIKNDPRAEAVQVVGITSAANVPFCKSLGVYDVVVTYDEVMTLPTESSVFVDMAGSNKLLKDIHEHFGSSLKYSCLVGQTNWEDAGPKDKTLPGPKPIFFFAPSHGQARAKEVGQRKFYSMLQQDWISFVKAVQKGNWCNIVQSLGPDQVRETYELMINTSPDPQVGRILSLWDSKSKRASARM